MSPIDPNIATTKLADLRFELASVTARHVASVESYLRQSDDAPMNLGEVLEDIANEYYRLSEEIAERYKSARKPKGDH